MALRIPTAAMLLLLVACSSPREGPVRDDPTYLEGITTKYSIRLDELRPQANHRHADFPGAVVAGDETITITASLLRQGPFLALDLVAQNRTGQPIVLQRDGIKLRDNLGTRLAEVDDFPGAEQIGLRGRATQRVAQGVQPSLDFGSRTSTPSPLTLGTPPLKQRTSRSDTDVAPAEAMSWGSDVAVEVQGAPAPEAIFLDPGVPRAYWAYWAVDRVEYPLFVMIHLEDRSLLLKFGEPTRE